MKKSIDLKKIANASLMLSHTSETQRDAFLKNLSKEVLYYAKKIASVNAIDVQRARASGISKAFIDRLILDENGVRHLAHKIAKITKLKSGLGEVIEKKQHGGLVLKKVRVSLGVLLIIYEARPEVTIDVAALCVKSGNAGILKGGSEALETNKILFTCVERALKKSGFPKEAISFIATGNRTVTDELLKRHDAIDLVIARGGYGMVRSVMEKTRIPVLAHAAGGARIYVDKSADLAMAEKIIVNAKITKPAACNAVDTIVVHTDIAKKFIPQITRAMRAHGVRVVSGQWDTEFLSLTVGIKQVANAKDAVEFVNRHSK
ncbi:glutamate-5-semialdehyde dehydrogenase, partial [Candidatus Kaiserbacteria bacterium]|nr:glutamate-5-semialdehyde dehydrogenase [Candidatus Kaiserbacteria bacterium]